jgi:HSP20 family protein
MLKDKKTFFERLAGSITVEDDDEDIIDINSDEMDDEDEMPMKTRRSAPETKAVKRPAHVAVEDEYEEEVGELSVDVYQTGTEIIIEAMVAGVKPEDLHLSITRDMVTIKGRREANGQVADDDYFYRELYWGNFSRTILLPHEIEIEEAEAVEKHGLLIIRMPKVDKARQAKIKVKSI